MTAFLRESAAFQRRRRGADLPLDSPELVLSALLAEYTEVLERRLAGASNRVKAAGKLVTISLQKRLLSSIEAFARTLSVHRKSAAKARAAQAKSKVKAPEPAVTQAPLFDDGDLSEELSAEIDDVAIERATGAFAAAQDDSRHMNQRGPRSRRRTRGRRLLRLAGALRALGLRACSVCGHDLAEDVHERLQSVQAAGSTSSITTASASCKGSPITMRLPRRRMRLRRQPPS